MQITCPKCNACGTIPDHEIPETGRFISCPRCKEGFTISKPRTGGDGYLVDTCPACSFSTFGEENFSTCPKCGVSIKSYIERQREEQLQKRNQELLAKKFNNPEVSALPPEAEVTPMADFIDNLHPVKLISWGTILVATVLISIGTWGVIGYDGAKIQTMLLQERDWQVSGLHVFINYGLPYWVKLLYGLAAATVAVLFMKRLKVGLKAMSGLLWATIFLVPVLYITSFVNWILTPVPHTAGGYLIEILNIIFMSALIGAPLWLLERYLHERKITSIVKL